MQAEMPFYEGPEDALRAAVQALGGSKKVGELIWPDKDSDIAGRMVLDRLNHNRPEKFEISQVMFIFRRAKEVGVHAPFEWFASEIGYDARPIAKEEREDRLASVIQESSRQFAAAVEALERLQRSRSPAVKVAA